jgi:spore germination protein YaaH
MIKIIFCILIFLLGTAISFFALKYFISQNSKSMAIVKTSLVNLGIEQREVIGFLPYWLLNKATGGYTNEITTLTYFGLTIDKDGSVKKYTRPGESEPGYLALTSGKVDQFLTNAKNNNLKLSLLVFAGNETEIKTLISKPQEHADKLIQEINPIMNKYGFTDLNIDIESVEDVTTSDQSNFAIFIKEIKNKLKTNNLGTLTVDSSPTDLIKKRLINVSKISSDIDKIVIMGYDFHFVGSLVTGPVAPINGANSDSEFDVETAIKLALNVIPKEKILLGIPAYGYQWETLTDNPRSGVMPGSGAVVSARSIQKMLSECASCSAKIDEEAKESYVTYKDKASGTFVQTFFPDQKATTEKISLANSYQLGGIAVWALGYEDDNILKPLEKYLQ